MDPLQLIERIGIGASPLLAFAVWRLWERHIALQDKLFAVQATLSQENRELLVATNTALSATTQAMQAATTAMQAATSEMRRADR